MLNKPKFMNPSTNRQECAIDINADIIPFSCIVDGNEAIKTWQIIIYNLSDNEIILKTDEIGLDPVFFPVDEKNRNVVFSVNLKDHIKDISAFLNRQEEYCWTITFWGTSGSSVTSYQEVFYANKSPDIEISYKYDLPEGDTDETLNNTYQVLKNGTVLTSRACIFKANYTQENTDETSIPLKRYGWRLTDTDSGQVLIDTISHNQIYGTKDNIVCYYSGFLNNGNYSIELYIETQNNMSVHLKPITFSISYVTAFLGNDFKVTALKNESAVMLDWNDAVIIGGKMLDSHNEMLDAERIKPLFKENYPIIDYNSTNPNTSLKIPESFRVVYNYGSNTNLDIDEDCYVVLSTQILTEGEVLNEEDEIVLFDAEGIDEDNNDIKRRLSFGVDESGNRIFRYTVAKGDIIKNDTYKVTYRPNRYVWYVIIMAPLITDESGNYDTTLIVTESRAVNGLYPSKTRYPKGSLYPSFGVWEKLKEA